MSCRQHYYFTDLFYRVCIHTPFSSISSLELNHCRHNTIVIDNLYNPYNSCSYELKYCLKSKLSVRSYHLMAYCFYRTPRRRQNFDEHHSRLFLRCHLQSPGRRQFIPLSHADTSAGLGRQTFLRTERTPNSGMSVSFPRKVKACCMCTGYIEGRSPFLPERYSSRGVYFSKKIFFYLLWTINTSKHLKIVTIKFRAFLR